MREVGIKDKDVYERDGERHRNLHVNRIFLRKVSLSSSVSVHENICTRIVIGKVSRIMS